MRFESLSDMPPALRARVEAELSKEKNAKSVVESEFSEKRQNKYNNSITEIGALKFDSRREARRYEELLIRLRLGEIDTLKLQPEFTITEAYIMPDGRRIKAQRYRADFSYRIISSGEVIVEDVKTEGTKTRVFINKQKLIYEKYGIDIKLI